MQCVLLCVCCPCCVAAAAGGGSGGGMVVVVVVLLLLLVVAGVLRVAILLRTATGYIFAGLCYVIAYSLLMALYILAGC